MSEKITVENLDYFHAKGTPYEIKALDGIDLNIQSGMITGLIGHTGSGKSTLVQMFNGLLKPYSGRVLLDGADIWAKPKEINKIRFRVGLVMQYPEHQLFEETIFKDIAFGPKNMGLKDEEIRERVLEAADFVGLDRSLLDKSPFDLSGGQKRRAAIAGIIAMRPELLILDEPAAGLDPSGREAIFGNIVEYRKKSGSTVLIVSHSMEDMARYCDRLIVLSKGKILLEGECREVFANSELLASVGLDIPQITKIMISLKQKGIDLDTSVFTVEEAFEKIMEIYRSEN